jgi:hypothetical protein
VCIHRVGHRDGHDDLLPMVRDGKIGTVCC